MLHLLWALLNIGVFLCFVFICIRATAFVREKLGLFASLLFVLGLLSFVGNSESDDKNREPGTNGVRSWKFVSEESVQNTHTATIEVELEETLISTYHLGITYAKDKEGGLIFPISGNSWAAGFMSGTSWNPSSIDVNNTSNHGQLEYQVIGIVEWKLLGATIYSQRKEYQGIAAAK